jgi:hypothetical protein
MNSLLHHVDRLVSGQVAFDARRMSEDAQKQLAIKVALVAAGAFLGTLLAGAALCAASKFAGIAVMLASPVLGLAAGAYALSFFTERYPLNRVVNFPAQVINAMGF